MAVTRRRLKDFVDYRANPPAPYVGRPEAYRGKMIHHVSAWAGEQFGVVSGKPAPPKALAMYDAAFQIRAAGIAHRRLARIVSGTAEESELDDSRQIAEYEAMRAATAAYLTALDLQAAALEFDAGRPLPSPGKQWPDARSAENSGNPRVQAWATRLKDGGVYDRLLVLRKAFAHKWFRRDVTVRIGVRGDQGVISTAKLDTGEVIPFDPAELDPVDELVVDQFITCAYLLVTGTVNPPSQ